MVTEAKRNGMVGHEEAANLTDIPNTHAAVRTPAET
jgi:hypothetical protein